MIHITEIAFSCYAVKNLAACRRFYEEILGLQPGMQFEDGGMGWVEYEIGPHTLALGCSPQFAPSSTGAMVALEVADFDSAVETLRDKQVKFKMDVQDFPSCRMAMIFDPDENVICIHQRKTAAAA